jgi:MYXO-CTERM domain-containing protein
MIVVLAGGGPVPADVAPPPPDDCPEWTTPSSAHGCAYCESRTCVDDTRCGRGRHCGTAALCVETVDCWSWSGSYQVQSTIAACPDGTCAAGSCETMRVCLPGAADADADGDADVGGDGEGAADEGGAGDGDADRDADAGGPPDEIGAEGRDGDAGGDAGGDGGAPTVVVNSPGCGCSAASPAGVLSFAAFLLVFGAALAVDLRRRRRSAR